MKSVIYAQLNKDYLGKDIGFTSIKDATIKHIGVNVAGTICARYYKGVGGNGDGLVIEINNEESSIC